MALSNLGSLRENDRTSEAISANTKTLDINDSGKVMYATITTVITLPDIATLSEPGVYYTIVNGGPKDGAVQITISPDANDAITGCDHGATANKDVVNTLATAKVGDRMELISGDEASVGWFIKSEVGTWADEA